MHFLKITFILGNAFVVNIALADLLITSVLIPASIIVLLSGVDDTSFAVCRFQWFLAACAFLVSVFSLAVSIFNNFPPYIVVTYIFIPGNIY